MIKKSKKAAEGVTWTVVVLVVLLLFLVLYSNAWTGIFRKSATNLKDQLDSAGDIDNDGVINLVDKCPCPKEGRIDSFENEGCPINYKIDGSKKDYEDRSCLTKKKT